MIDVESRIEKSDYLISIIIPAYNASNSIKRCVESALHQTYPLVEIIIVDDGSSDDTGMIADKLATHDGRVKVIHQPNRGLSGARNTGIDCAAGNFLFFLDSDDVIESFEIEALLSSLLANDADYAVGGLALVDSADRKLGVVVVENQVINEEMYWEQAYIEKPEKSVEYIISCGKLFKAELFANCRFELNKFHEDEYIIHKITSISSRIAFVDKPGYVYIQNNSSIMHSEDEKSYLDAAEALLLRVDYFLNKGWLECAWGALLNCRVPLAEVKRSSTEASADLYKMERLYDHWKKHYVKLKHLRFGSMRQRLTNILFLACPLIFVYLNRSRGNS